MKTGVSRDCEAQSDHFADARASGVDPLIPRRRALRAMGMSASTGDRREKSDPSFPARIEIGPQRFAYRASDVKRWIDSRPTTRRSEAA